MLRSTNRCAELFVNSTQERLGSLWSPTTHEQCTTSRYLYVRHFVCCCVYYCNFVVVTIIVIWNVNFVMSFVVTFVTLNLTGGRRSRDREVRWRRDEGRLIIRGQAQNPDVVSPRKMNYQFIWSAISLWYLDPNTCIDLILRQLRAFIREAFK